MKNISFFLLPIILIGCSSIKNNSNKTAKNDVYVSDRYMKKEEFFPMFKMSVFLHSLKYSFNNSPEIKKILTEDKSNISSSEYLNIEDVDAVAKMIVEKIKQDSVKSIGYAAEGSEGKTVFAICVEFYYSKKLDSIARKLYKTKYSKPYVLHQVTSDTLKNK
jgi:hypothetical protein